MLAFKGMKKHFIRSLVEFYNVLFIVSPYIYDLNVDLGYMKDL